MTSELLCRGSQARPAARTRALGSVLAGGGRGTARPVGAAVRPPGRGRGRGARSRGGARAQAGKASGQRRGPGPGRGRRQSSSRGGGWGQDGHAQVSARGHGERGQREASPRPTQPGSGPGSPEGKVPGAFGNRARRGPCDSPCSVEAARATPATLVRPGVLPSNHSSTESHSSKQSSENQNKAGQLPPQRNETSAAPSGPPSFLAFQTLSPESDPGPNPPPWPRGREGRNAP